MANAAQTNAPTGTSPACGRVVVLNGTSCAGKTTLADALRDEFCRRGSLWFVVNNDTFVFWGMGYDWFRLPDREGPHANRGFSFDVQPDGGVRPMVGAEGRLVLRAYHRAVAAMATAGLNVIVEGLVFDAADWDDWQSALDGIPTSWLAVRAPLDVCEAREAGREYTAARGTARGMFEVVHAHAVYDLEVDTTTGAPAALAGEVVAKLLLMSTAAGGV